MRIALIQPPVQIPTEPPASITAVGGWLHRQGIETHLIDLGIEALYYLLEPQRLSAAKRLVSRGSKAWVSLTKAQKAVDDLKEMATFTDHSAYKNAIVILQRSLKAVSKPHKEMVSLTDHQVEGLNPFEPDELVQDAIVSLKTNYLFRSLFEQTCKKLGTLKPDLVGISVTYRQQICSALRLAVLIKERLHRTIPVILGGGLLTAWADAGHNLKPLTRVVDAIVVGEAAPVLEQILPNLSNRKLWVNIPGLWTAQSEQKPRPAKSFSRDYIAPPLIQNLQFDRYLSPIPIIPLTLSRGCYWRKCAFCPETVHSRGHVVADIDLIVEWVARELQSHTPAILHITDSSLPISAAVKFAAALRDRRVRVAWYAFVRFEPALAKPFIVRKLQESGCMMLQLGLESGSPKLLELLCKGIDLEVASRVLRALSNANISSYVYVMAGMPEETMQDLNMTEKFLEHNRGAISYLHVSVMNLSLGTALHRQPERFSITNIKRLRNTYGQYSLCRAFETSQMIDRKVLRPAVERILLRNPAIKAMVSSTPPVLGANLAPVLEFAKRRTATLVCKNISARE